MVCAQPLELRFLCRVMPAKDAPELGRDNRKPRTPLWGLLGLAMLWLAPGYSLASSQSTNLVLSVSYAFPQPQVEVVHDGTEISIVGCDVLDCPGGLRLPMRTAWILLPPGRRVTRATAEPIGEPEALTGSWRTARAWRGGQVLADTGGRQSFGGAKVLSRRMPPTERVQLLSIQRLLGYDVALLRLFPVQYATSSDQLFFASHLKVTLSLTLEEGSDQKPTQVTLSDSVRERLVSLVDNPAELASWEAATSASTQAAGEKCDYLLITTQALQPAFAPLLQHKARKGLTVKSESVESITNRQPGRDSAEKVRNYIRSAWANWGVQYVLLGGDVATVPCRYVYIKMNEPEPNCYLPSDLYFACLDGSWNRDGDKRWGEPTDGEDGGEVDLLAEVFVGRAPVDTVAEVADFVEKTIRYENSGSAKSGEFLLAAEYLGHFSPDIDAQGGDMFEPLLPRLAQVTVSWLDDRPFTTPQWSNTQAIAALNRSPHVVLYNGHGETDQMLRLKPADLLSITNSTPFLAYSVGCHAGRFDNDRFSPDSIAEELLKLPRHGAFAAVLNPRAGWFDPRKVWRFSGEHQIKFFEEMLNKDQVNLGKAFQLAKHALVGQVENAGVMAYRWCYFQLNLLGDPQTPMLLSASTK